MGLLQIQQIRRALERDFRKFVDLSDVSSRDGKKVEQCGLSRALAAFVIAKRYRIDPEVACASIVDGRDDNGIDAVLCTTTPQPTLVICQSKWSDTGRSGADKSAILKLKDGIGLLVSTKWDSFNDRVSSRAAELTAALDETELKIEVLFVSMGVNDIEPSLSRIMTDYLDEEFNDGVAQWDDSATASFSYLGQNEVLALLAAEQAPKPFDIETQISDWGRIDEPHKAVYGHVAGHDVAEWVRNGGRSLLTGNVRFGLGDTSTNSQIDETARNSPELFWYFNNGLTLLCESIAKTPANGSDRRAGMFEFKGVQLVNGAQTASTLLNALDEADDGDKPIRVMVRFISLESTSDDFGQRVTRATNTQNAINGRDFAALDPGQERLRTALAIDHFRYILKRGEERTGEPDECDFAEAASALATILSPELATQAKREVGRLWADTSKSPYTDIFSSATTHVRLRRAVEFNRSVAEALSDLEETKEPRERSYCIHGNRLLTYIVARRLMQSSIGARLDLDQFDNDSWQKQLEDARELTPKILDEMIQISEETYGGYVASLFKNKAKTQYIANFLCEQRD